MIANRTRMLAKPRLMDALFAPDETALITVTADPTLTSRFDERFTTLTPSVVQPDPVVMSAATWYDVRGGFMCTRAGQARITYTASFATPVRWRRAIFGDFGADVGEHEAKYEVRVEGAPFRCVTTATINVYSVVVSDPDGDALEASWSGPDCGAWQPPIDRLVGQGGFEMTWTHDHARCHPVTLRLNQPRTVLEEPNPKHDATIITLSVTDGAYTVVCTYTSVRAGTGTACAAPTQNP
jgi:hypothetical protein